MRLNNPPQGVLSTVNVGTMTSPPILATLTGATINATSAVDIAADPDRADLIVTNLSQTLPLYAASTSSTTTQVGTLIGPQVVGVLTTAAAVRLINPGASSVAYIANQTKWR